MNIEDLIYIINDQNEIIKDLLRDSVERELINKTEILKGRVLLVSGIRRSGKTVFSLQLANKSKENFIYINFFDERFIDFSVRDFNKLLEAIYRIKNPNLLILDEIQEIKGWEKFVERIRNKFKIIVTGSNSRLLSKEIGTYLTGRYIKKEIFPFSFKEFLLLKNFKFDFTTEKKAKLKNLLNEYIKLGGFPEVYKYGRIILQDLFNDIVERDLILRYNIKNKYSFKKLAIYLISNYSSFITANKTKNIVSIKDVHTVLNYFEYLENSYLLFFIDKYSTKTKEKILSAKKVYAIDTGLINTLSLKSFSEMGRIIENIVFLQLKRNISYNSLNLNISYYKTKDNKEIDFVLYNEENKVEKLIEVTYEFDEEHKKKLIKAMEELNLKESLCITWGEEDIIEEKGKKIKIIPLWKWLLEIN